MSYTLQTVLHRFEQFILGDTNDYISVRNKKGEFNYIPLDEDTFLKQISLISILSKAVTNRSDGLTFVDVGCGIGTKLLLADIAGGRTFSKIYGIEIDARYAKLAKKLVSHKDNSRYNSRISNPEKFAIIRKDALTTSYKPFDVIYFYCPLLDHLKQRKLEEQIVTTARKGALILPNLFHNHELWRSDKVKLLAENGSSYVYQKV